MQDFEKLGAFYLGRTDKGALLYNSKDLVTHAICVGMTGSGKTGLCISLLEEAAIDGVPAIVIDPKGDLANLLLQFPDLKGPDFEPWVAEEEAQRQGISKERLAANTAQSWKDGLAKWGEDGDRIQRLKDSADFSIYTPGSNAGLSVSVLRSFDAPTPETRDDREAFREQIASTVTALLGLLQIDADPLQSREHILLSKILETAWAKGNNLDLPAIIAQIQNPPITRIGVMELDAFFPSKERFALAVQLNNLIASPGFEAWMEGDPLDVKSLLYTSKGKPRISIFSIAHLSDAERMFFVSLLLNQTLSWMRTQPGTSSLRAIVYMDEIFGYFPPVANPPSKQPLLTLLKQARAFGVGVVLATQNPVDLDYKGLSNCGTWLIGRLQTERDKARLVEGLVGAATASGGKADPAALDKLLSSLAKRVFLINNVHTGEMEVFETRWALSFLAGPVTKSQIRVLMAGRKPAAAAANGGKSEASSAAQAMSAAVASARPVLPGEIPQFFLPTKSSTPPVYQPVLLAHLQARYADDKAGVDFTEDVTIGTPVTTEVIPVKWEDAEVMSFDLESLEKEPVGDAQYEELATVATKPKSYAGWTKDLITYICANRRLELFVSPSTGKKSEPGESEGDFRIRISTEAREQRDQAVEDLRKNYSDKLARLDEKIRRAQEDVAQEKSQMTSQAFSSVLAVGTSLLGAFLGKKAITTTEMSRVATAAKSIGRTVKEHGDVSRAEEDANAMAKQKSDMEAEVQAEIAALQTKYDVQKEEFRSVSIAPKKTNVAVRLFALGWSPAPLSDFKG